jgi:hypothetical protein
VTENLSRRAATVFTNSAIETGRFVRVTSAEQQVSLLAAVRSRSTGADGRIRLSVEFISGAWPLKGVE